jgi:hypothetical protein
MEGWERKLKDGNYERGDKSYREEDLLGQKGLTDATFDWLEDDAKPHPNRLDVSLTEFRVILAIFQSVVERAPVYLPSEPPEGLLDALRTALS